MKSSIQKKNSEIFLDADFEMDKECVTKNLSEKYLKSRFKMTFPDTLRNGLIGPLLILMILLLQNVI